MKRLPLPPPPRLPVWGRGSVDYPPSWKIKNKFPLCKRSFATFSSCGTFLLRFFLHGGPLSPCEGLFATFFSMWGGAFFVLMEGLDVACSPSLQNNLWTLMPHSPRAYMLPPLGAPMAPPCGAHAY